jgi:hypothetical protein
MNMKKIIYSLFLFCSLIVFVGCEGITSEDPSKITYFADIKLDGDVTVLWPLGEAFVEPGYSAEMQGEDITSQIKVTGLPNTNEAGIYTITYSAINADGFPASVSRTVFVYDPTPSVLESGFYTVNKSSYRKVLSSGVTVAYGSDFDIAIFQVEPGVFYVSDLFGGWYAQRAGYGSSYEMNSYVALNDDNTFELLDSYNAGWGDGMSEFYDATYDPETATISWAPEYVEAYIFYQTITKK